MQEGEGRNKCVRSQTLPCPRPRRVRRLASVRGDFLGALSAVRTPYQRQFDPPHIAISSGEMTVWLTDSDETLKRSLLKTDSIFRLVGAKWERGRISLHFKTRCHNPLSGLGFFGLKSYLSNVEKSFSPHPVHFGSIPLHWFNFVSDVAGYWHTSPSSSASVVASYGGERNVRVDPKFGILKCSGQARPFSSLATVTRSPKLSFGRPRPFLPSFLHHHVSEVHYSAIMWFAKSRNYGLPGQIMGRRCRLARARVGP